MVDVYLNPQVGLAKPKKFVIQRRDIMISRQFLDKFMHFGK